MNIMEHVSSHICAKIPLGCIPVNSVTGSQGIVCLSLQDNVKLICQRGCISFYFQQPSLSILNYLSPCQYLALSGRLIFADMLGTKMLLVCVIWQYSDPDLLLQYNFNMYTNYSCFLFCERPLHVYFLIFIWFFAFSLLT